jgi:hypothetical protein
MPRNASGTYTAPAGNPVVSGTTISSTVHNATIADLAAELTDSLSRSGKGGMAVPFQNAGGDEAEPGITFTADTGTGFFRDVAGEIGVSSAGSEVARFKATGLELTPPLPRGSLPAVGPQVSSASGAWITNAIVYTDVTNLTVTITTTGRPVMIMTQPDGTNPGLIGNAAGGVTDDMFYRILRGASTVAEFSGISTAANTSQTFPGILFMDAVVAGTYTYKVQVKCVAGGNTFFGNQVLIAYEL